MRAIRGLVPALLVMVVLWGCAAPDVRRSNPWEPGQGAVDASQKGWWYAQFAVNWPEGREPSWHLDPLLAHRVVSPILQQYRGDLMLWRFHRRAARDQAGHQFSFIFHASQETARGVCAALQADPLLGELKARGVIVRHTCDDPSAITRPNLEDTSDRHWPHSIQRSWPYYIQGVSEMWLNLIAEVAIESLPDNPSSGLDELLAYYEGINVTVSQLWRDEGQHAFLHHLNALFGYEPLLLREKRLIKF